MYTVAVAALFYSLPSLWDTLEMIDYLGCSTSGQVYLPFSSKVFFFFYGNNDPF